jgi:hypothetical protein
MPSLDNRTPQPANVSPVTLTPLSIQLDQKAMEREQVDLIDQPRTAARIGDVLDAGRLRTALERITGTVLVALGLRLATERV